ncbi:MAG: hypothetical protein MJ229_06985 [bacterium]|nr:hypothetical protein [bacterium]
MLGSVGQNQENYFAMADSAYSSRASEAISTYVGNVGVSKKPDIKLLGAEDDKAAEKTGSNAVKFPKNKDTKTSEIEKEENKNILEKDEDSDGIVDIFEDEEESEVGIIYGSDISALTRSFNALAATVGSSDDRVTKSQLVALLQNLSGASANNEEYKEEISFIKNLIAKFDVISNGEGYITSFSGMNEPQDFKTVTEEQVTSPVSLLI